MNQTRKKFNTPLALVVVVAVAFVAIKLFLTRGSVLPGLDGAYYWVQVRNLISEGQLAFDDLPLIFVIQAGLSLLLGDIPLAVRLSDAVLPALSAIPIYLLTKDSGKSWLAPAITAAALLNPWQLFFFTGNFIKNESAVPLIFVLALVLYRWDQSRRWVSLLLLASTLFLLSMAHFGVLLLALTILISWILFELRNKSARSWLVAGAFALAGISAALVTLYAVVPARFARLLEAVLTPNLLFSTSNLERILSGQILDLSGYAIVLGQLSCLLIAVIAWKIRDRLSFSSKSLIAASTIATFIFSSPLVAPDWSWRISAMAFVPMLIAFSMIMKNVSTNGRGVLLTVALIATSASSFIPSFGRMSQLFSDEQYKQFQQMAAEVQLEENSLVIAEHGYQYLVAWDFKTKVVLGEFFEETNQDDYEAIYAFWLERPSEAGGKSATPYDYAYPSLVAVGNYPPMPPVGVGYYPNGNGLGEIKLNLRTLEGARVYENNGFVLLKLGDVTEKPVSNPDPIPEIPNDFPAEIPIITGEVTLGIVTGEGQEKFWIIAVSAADYESSIENLGVDLGKAGFKVIKESKAETSYEGVFTSDLYTVQVEVTEDSMSGSANFTYQVFKN